MMASEVRLFPHPLSPTMPRVSFSSTVERIYAAHNRQHTFASRRPLLFPGLFTSSKAIPQTPAISSLNRGIDAVAHRIAHKVHGKDGKDDQRTVGRSASQGARVT